MADRKQAEKKNGQEADRRQNPKCVQSPHTDQMVTVRVGDVGIQGGCLVECGADGIWRLIKGESQAAR